MDLASIITAMLLSAGLPAAADAAPERDSEPAHRYHVRVDRELSTLAVHACFADSLPHHFNTDDPLARDALIEASILLNGKRRHVHPHQGALRFPVPSDDGCLDYRIDLEQVTATPRLNHAYRLPDTILLTPQTWLWRPWSRGGHAIEFVFELPDNMAVSVPWQPLDKGPHHRRFRMADTPFDWQALMAIGHLHTREIRIPGSTLHMAVLPGPGKADAGMAHRWLKPAALAISTLHGGFPEKNVQLLVVPIDGGLDAAPWAEVTRGGGQAVHFYMNAAADWPVFRDDWIATHELSHLAIPFVSRRDKWLSEGIASYYQNILRARIGLLSEREAWQAMADGFRRGRNATGTTVAADSTNLWDAALDAHNPDRFMRVYWTGAAIALLGDIDIRQRTANRWSLDRLLAEIRNCCHEPGKIWRARDVFAHFDRVTGEDVFLPLHDEHVYSRFFPRLDAAWSAIGITVKDGEAQLQAETAQQEQLRRLIMYPDVPPNDGQESTRVSSE